MKPILLRVGDTVIWRGSWGKDAARYAVVTGIERTERPDEKYGTPVLSITWPMVQAGYAIVDLDNGSWAYGFQLEPLPGAPICRACGAIGCYYCEVDPEAVCVDCGAIGDHVCEA